MLKLIHVSDLHFHQSTADNSAPAKLLEKIKSVPDIDYLIVTGDITDDGVKKQFKRATNALKPFKNRLLLVPGNHDYGPFGNVYFVQCAEYFDKQFLNDLEPGARFIKKHPYVKLIEKDGVKLLTVGLNSVLKTASILDFARGGIGKSQLASLDEILSRPEFAGVPKLVYMHHRPGKFDKWVLEMNDTEEFMKIIAIHDVAVLAFGHSGNNNMDVASMDEELSVLRENDGKTFILNANGSRKKFQYFEITVDGGNVNVQVK
jgi:3',5'-cyclic AMP phosphodiesterase CpdA